MCSYYQNVEESRIKAAHNFDTCSENAAAQWRIPTNLAAMYVFHRNAPFHSGILFASTKVVRRPRYSCCLHFDIWNILQIRMEKSNASAQRLLSAAMLERWPQVCRVKITFTLLPTNCFASTRTNSMKCLMNFFLI